MDKWRTHDAADVVCGSVGEILGQEIRTDLRGRVVAPTFEDRFLAALMVVATVGRQ